MYPTVTVCGSMRFAADMVRLAGELTLRGALVLMPHVVKTGNVAEAVWLDRMHFEKIRRSDAVVVATDAARYIGESTRREIQLAHALGIWTDLWFVDGPDDQLVLDAAAHAGQYGGEFSVDLDALAAVGARFTAF